MMTLPGDIEDELVTALHAHFDEDEIMELSLYVMKWNGQKIKVSLGIDSAVSDEHLTFFDIDPDGKVLW